MVYRWTSISNLERIDDGWTRILAVIRVNVKFSFQTSSNIHSVHWVTLYSDCKLKHNQNWDKSSSCNSLNEPYGIFHIDLWWYEARPRGKNTSHCVSSARISARAGWDPRNCDFRGNGPSRLSTLRKRWRNWLLTFFVLSGFLITILLLEQWNLKAAIRVRSRLLDGNWI